jgi:MFS family permease
MANLFANMLIVGILLTPPGLLIGGLLVAWRRWRWPWRAVLIVPFALAVYAIMAIRTVIFGTNLTEYDAVLWYLLRIVAAYVVALLLFIPLGVAALVRRPGNETPKDGLPKTTPS